jgi:hypothetical protein
LRVRKRRRTLVEAPRRPQRARRLHSRGQNVHERRGGDTRRCSRIPGRP